MNAVETREAAPQVVGVAAPAPGAGAGSAIADMRRTAEPGRLAEALAAMDDASRARVTNALQRSAGNSAVTRMLTQEASRRRASGAAQLQRSPEMVPIVVGGTNLGIGAYLAAGGTVAGGTALAEGTAVVAATVLAEGAAVVGTTAVAGGATVVAVPAAAAATATGGVATAGAVAGGSATVPVIGWIVAGVIVGGIVIYLVYRATRDERPPGVQAPPASQGAPVAEPSSGPAVSLPPQPGPSSGPIREPGPSVPASLPSDQPPVPVLASGSPDDVPGNLERLERLERSGDFFGDAGALRGQLRSTDAATRAAAERQLRDYERAAADYRRIQDQQDSAGHGSATEDESVERAVDPTVRRIAEPGGDAWEYHRAEFLRFDVTTPEELAELLDRIVEAPDASKTAGNRKAYWDGRTGTIVIVDPTQPHGGTGFRPDDGRSYFDRWPNVGPPRGD